MLTAQIVNLHDPTLKPSVRISHGPSESLEFRVNSFGMDALRDRDVFEQLNAFWATLSLQDHAYVFDLYRKIYDLLTTDFEMLIYVRDLNRYVAELLNFHEYERMRHWLVFMSDVVIPCNFSEEYKPAENKKTSREQTYTKGEYVGLVTLSVIFRTLIPVWGEFIACTKRETGTKFKEYYAFQLCSKSQILHSDPFQKLKLYVDLAIGDDNQDKDNIIEGISSEDFVNWMIARIFVRRLCVGDISGTGENPEANLVTSVRKFVTQQIKSDDTAGDTSIKNKENDDGGSMDSVDKLSVLERYKNKHNISIGDITVLEYSVSNLPALAFRLSQNMTMELLERSLSSVQMLNTIPIRDPQITLLRWVMKPVISPQGILYLSKPSIVNLLGVAQAVLWARGYHFLAMLVTSYADIASDELRVSGMDSRAQLSKEKRARLDELYPYMKNIGSRRSGQKPVNMAVHSIDIIVENLSVYSWKLSADTEMVELATGPNPAYRLTIPYSIRNDLADLVIEIGSHTWK